MKKLLVLLVVFISFNSFSNVVESSLNENKPPKKGFNYKKMKKKNARCKRRNIFGCKNYTFNR
jgi:hypothetical protein